MTIMCVCCVVLPHIRFFIRIIWDSGQKSFSFSWILNSLIFKRNDQNNLLKSTEAKVYHWRSEMVAQTHEYFISFSFRSKCLIQFQFLSIQIQFQFGWSINDLINSLFAFPFRNDFDQRKTNIQLGCSDKVITKLNENDKHGMRTKSGKKPCSQLHFQIGCNCY